MPETRVDHNYLNADHNAAFHRRCSALRHFLLSASDLLAVAAEEWDDLKKGHPKAASLRTITLNFPNLCARLFDGNSATSNFRSYSTQSSSVAGASSCRVPPLQITATHFLAINDDGDGISHHASEPPPSTASPYIASPSEKLEVLQLGPTDPLSFVAYHIFGGTINLKETWMHLSDVPEILPGCFEMTGTSLGVLKDGKIVR
ncbi:unnamed protein product [Lactuca saligna]|uniref:Uncharacterized protein n=1 Tax=Lactuca saligna TaxID=75948 RepID=A0AA35ZD08_LACSI|nr:unnamed protein product [Lactuca saligna]